MIVFGSRMYGRKNTVKGWGYCDKCGKYAKNTSYTGRKWGHLYFIPLIPEGPRVRVVKECTKCSNGVHIPETDVPIILNDLRQSTKNALAALISGEKTFDDNGTTTPATAHLAGSVELLLCLEADDHLRLVLAALQEKQLAHAYHLTNGESLEFHGKLDEAAEAYRQAAKCEPHDPFALMSCGTIHMKKKDLKSARDDYEKALALTEDKFPVLQTLLTVYESIKDHTRLAETYEQCFDHVPELAGDRNVFKAYIKACRKAGRQPLDR